MLHQGVKDEHIFVRCRGPPPQWLLSCRRIDPVLTRGLCKLGCESVNRNNKNKNKMDDRQAKQSCKHTAHKWFFSLGSSEVRVCEKDEGDLRTKLLGCSLKCVFHVLFGLELMMTS